VDVSIHVTLVTILGREVALRKAKLTWVELLRENKSLDSDVSGLTV
jgi:hypothetical protein